MLQKKMYTQNTSPLLIVQERGKWGIICPPGRQVSSSKINVLVKKTYHLKLDIKSSYSY